MKPWQPDDLRRAFLDYFRTLRDHRDPARDAAHEIVPSDSLVPAGDPTLLFTGAGMNQFKDQFLGTNVTYRRAATCQKCLRVGDLDVVGTTAAHHTFFEMLGNFSFGDYFKEGAIVHAWRFFTETLGIDAGRLYVSVYEEDEEAFEIWHTHPATKLPDDRIFKAGAKDNFWPSNAPTAGPNGPCGPCSEIYFDTGASLLDRPGLPGALADGFHPDNRRFVEVWNLVFTGYNRTGPVPGAGTLEPLPSQNIDTGMGFERLLAVLNGDLSNFETALFQPILARVAELARRDYDRGSPHGVRLRRIADHARAAVFCLADGVRPGRDGREYVLRKIIRRAMRDGLDLGIEEPFLQELVPVIAQIMGAAWPNVPAQEAVIRRALEAEQEQFLRIVAKGLPIARGALRDFARRAGKEARRDADGNLLEAAAVFPAEEAYRLYETYGIPFDFQRDLALQEFGVDLDEADWKRFLKDRKGEKQGKGDVFAEGPFDALKREKPATRFVGYERLMSQTRFQGAFWDTRIPALAPWNEEFVRCYERFAKDGLARAAAWRNGREPIVTPFPIDRWPAGWLLALVCEESPFYGEGGGQVGDTGTIEAPPGGALAVDDERQTEHVVGRAGARATVLDTQRADGYLLHVARLDAGEFYPGQPVTLAVDGARRRAIMRHHTATHLLHAVLRGCDRQARQAGSLVKDDLLRFDVEVSDRALLPDAAELERRVAELVCRDYPVTISEGPKEEAEAAGVVMFFDEKYGDTVRTVRVGEHVSAELCGGCHVARTGEIGAFRIDALAPIGAHVLRVTARAGEAAQAGFAHERALLETLRGALKAGAVDELPAKVEKLADELRGARKEIARLKILRTTIDARGPAGQGAVTQVAPGVRLLAQLMDAKDAADLGDTADRMRENIGDDAVVVLGAPTDKGKAALAVSIAPALVQGRGLDAGRLARELALLVDGTGGGKRGFARAGGTAPEKLPAALARAPALLAAALEGTD